MRDYTIDELLWEYSREYKVFASQTFPQAFIDFEDFARRYVAAPTYEFNFDKISPLRNFSGPFRTLSAVEAAMGHRRDVEKIASGLRTSMLPPPIILKRSMSSHYLMSGNTRLAVSTAINLPINVKIIEV